MDALTLIVAVSIVMVGLTTGFLRTMGLCLAEGRAVSVALHCAGSVSRIGHHHPRAAVCQR
jgi:uncharacterized membrane protein required for colicin V production